MALKPLKSIMGAGMARSLQ